MSARMYTRLVGYECRKMFLNRGMLVFFAVLLAFNGWKICNSYERKVEYWDDYETQYLETYAYYCGEITVEKITAIKTIYQPLEAKYKIHTLNFEYDPEAYLYSEGLDEKFYRELFYTELKYDYLYQNEAYRIRQNALQLAQMYESLDNRYEISKNRIIAEDFYGRRIPCFSDTRGYDVLLNYDYSSMIVLLLSVFALCGAFVCEHETDMFMLLRTTKNGSSMTVAAKLTATLLFVVVTCALFFGQDFLCIYFSSDRNTALQSPIYALREMETTHLTMSIAQYFLLAAIVKTFGIAVCSVLTLLVSTIMKQTLGSFFASFAILIGNVVALDFGGDSGLWLVNPMQTVFYRDVVNRDAFANVFGQAVRLSYIVIACSLIVLLVAIAAIVSLNRSYHNRRRRKADASV